jgi:hypothetical protein
MSHPLWALIPITAVAIPPGSGSVLLYSSQESCQAQISKFGGLADAVYACVPAYMDPAEFQKVFGKMTPQ